jgi:flagellar P-ring protein precursor FlgI
MKNLFLVITLLFVTHIEAASKLKDLVTVKGVRDNPLIGYGLVIGLNGTGDGGGELTNKSLKKMFATLGLQNTNEVSSANVAAVIVTANLPPFGRQGQKMDVTVSSVGTASSLAGGTLLVTPLKGGDGQVYAVASGPLSIGGLTQGAKYATTGKIPDGAIVEREIPLQFNSKKALRLALKQPDFTTAARIQKVINESLGGKFASAADSATIDLIIPPHYQNQVVNLLAVLERVKVNQDAVAKIVINERTGTIVAGGDIRLNPVAISHGDLIIQVGEGKKGATQALHMIDKKGTLNELVNALNALGTGPEDLISIFQTLKKNGALVAELEFI